MDSSSIIDRRLKRMHADLLMVPARFWTRTNRARSLAPPDCVRPSDRWFDNPCCIWMGSMGRPTYIITMTAAARRGAARRRCTPAETTSCKPCRRSSTLSWEKKTPTEGGITHTAWRLASSFLPPNRRSVRFSHVSRPSASCFLFPF